MDYDLTRRVLQALEQTGVEYVVIGGVALNLHGLPRTTEDLDIFVAPNVDNIERLKTALRSVYDDPCIDEITAADLLGDYPAVRYYPPTGDLYFDVLTRLGEMASFETVESQIMEFEGIRVTVATPAALFRLKKATVRAKDHQDAAALQQRFNLPDGD